jgi:hypothetical protein
MQHINKRKLPPDVSVERNVWRWWCAEKMRNLGSEASIGHDVASDRILSKRII